VAQDNLFQPLGRAQVGNPQDSALLALQNDRALEIMQYTGINADALRVDADAVMLNFGPGLMVPANRTNSYLNDDGSVTWIGAVADPYGALIKGTGPDEIADPMNEVILVRNGDKVTANARISGQWFAIRPLHDGRHVIAAVDEKQMPPDHPERDYQHIFDQSSRPSVLLPEDEVRAISTIRVMVHYTSSAASASGDINGLINLAVAETNQGYTNSGVEISLVLAHKSQVVYTQTGSFSTDLSRYRGTTDSYMTDVHTTRNSTASDIGVLLINNSSSCGLASAIGASATTAFAVAHYGCATGYYSFGHEIGHLQAARHDPANDPSTTPYAYGHGFQKTSAGWRTIMAYNCSPSCTRLNYWSNPGKTYGGAAMGTTTQSHNQRVLNNTKASIAAFR
jgi:hypothetical protein